MKYFKTNSMERQVWTFTTCKAENAKTNCGIAAMVTLYKYRNGQTKKKKRTLGHLKKNHLHPITRMKTKNQIIICNLWEWINDKLPFQVIYTPPLIPFSHRPKRISNMKPLISYEMTIIASPECIVPLSSPFTYPKFTFTIS